MRALLFLCAGLASAHAALAQEDLVVTAERRLQDLGTLPASVARLQGEEIAAVGAQAPSELLNRLPGVGVQRNNGLENLPAIRSPVLNGGQSAGSFLILEDGVPIRAAGFNNVNQLFEAGLDFASAVEVVRGPGSALYGSNAVHGLVNVVTPIEAGDRDAPPLGLTIEAGAYGRARGRLLWSRDPGEGGGFASALGLAVTQEDGWREAAGLDQQSLYAALAGRAGAWTMSAAVSAQNLNQETAGFIEGAEAYRSEAAARANPTPEAYRDSRLIRGRITLERSLGETSLVRFKPYARQIETDLSISFLPSRAQELTDQSGLGLQSSWYYDPSPELSLIVGADVEAARAGLYEFQFRPTTGTFTRGLHYDYRVRASTAAVYAQARWAFAPAWSLTAGVRGERVSFDYENETSNADVGRFRRPADRTDKFEAITPKLGLVRTLGERSSVWLNLARGARPPQATDLYSLQTTQTPGGQEVETLDAAELGWRRAAGPLSAEIVLYHMDKRDTAFRNADGFTVTGAETRHQGVEVSAAWQASETLELTGWATYARHTYRFTDIARSPFEVIRTGADIDTAPRWLGNARAAWAPLPTLELELEWAHVGPYFTNAANTRRYEGHDLFHLRGRWLFAPEAELFAALRNVGDTRYAERADFAFGVDRYFPGEPRNLSVGLALQR